MKEMKRRRKKISIATHFFLHSLEILLRENIYLKKKNANKYVSGDDTLSKHFSFRCYDALKKNTTN